MNAAFKRFVGVAAKMVGQHLIEETPFEIDATRPMFEMDSNSFRFVLSEEANAFIADNDLGAFSIRYDGKGQWLKIIAPTDFARVMFRARF